MDFKITVRTYTGAVKTVEVTDMPSEEAARAEAVAMTFGSVLSIERTDGSEATVEPPKSTKKRMQLPDIEKELKPGETETIVTGYDNNPLAVFSLITGDDIPVQ